jgi:hypothetical protein
MASRAAIGLNGGSAKTTLACVCAQKTQQSEACLEEWSGELGLPVACEQIKASASGSLFLAMASPAMTGTKNCTQSAIKKTGAIHSNLRRKGRPLDPTLDARFYRVKRGGAADYRGTLIGRRYIFHAAWQKDNNHIVLKNKENLSARLPRPRDMCRKRESCLASPRR